MLPKSQRLDTQGVALVFGSKRKTKANTYFKVIIAQNEAFSHKKYAVVVSKKVASNAVLRNKIRRRVYSGIYQMNLSPTPGFGVVIQCLKKSTSLSAGQFRDELQNIITKSFS